VAGVVRAVAAAVVAGRAEAPAGRGDEPRDAASVGEIGEDAQHGGRLVELAVSAAESAAGEEARPALARERRVEEERAVVGRDG
jgi:hypothetical protein